MCLDVSGVNETALRERYPISKAEELIQDMVGRKIFSKLDFKMGYHQFEFPYTAHSHTLVIGHRFPACLTFEGSSM